ncbi:hypothetical protein VR7878_02110 [Vibrio ruber DSM 16370]|uniref:Uncharacterized protein n=1 Tax=Vibrio ruber (strain DSM 16370 / JCM 11486 / BCRC 17186 / CECT 7878 / LMG 23124 / VR1) TaxID=1123498 RepID=A0A1R4LKF4_VIBR1|nr:hypothetical protein VR7878_02110 [Vibrio ruber DSM 16370]
MEDRRRMNQSDSPKQAIAVIIATVFALALGDTVRRIGTKKKPHRTVWLECIKQLTYAN